MGTNTRAEKEVLEGIRKQAGYMAILDEDDAGSLDEGEDQHLNHFCDSLHGDFWGSDTPILFSEVCRRPPLVY